MGAMWKVLFGLSPIVAIMLYFVLSKQQVLENSFENTEQKFEKSIVEFNKDFAEDSLLFTNNKNEAERINKRIEREDNKLKKIQETEDLIQAKKEASARKIEEALGEIEKDFDMTANF